MEELNVAYLSKVRKHSIAILAMHNIVTSVKSSWTCITKEKLATI